MFQLRLVQHDRWVRLVIVLIMALGLGAGLVSPAPVAAVSYGGWTSNGSGTKVLTIAIDPHNDQVIYAGGPGGLWKTTNGGGTWGSVNTTTPVGKDLLVDPFTATTLYALHGSNQQILKGTNGGGTWATVYTASTGNYLNALVADPNHANVLYAALQGGTAQIIRSLDAGATWSLITDPSLGQGGIGGAQVTGLAMLPGVSDTLYASVQTYHGGMIIKTANASATPTPTWVTIATGAQVLPLSSPFGVVAAGSAADRAVYSSWTVMGTGELARNDNDGAAVKLGSNLPLRNGSASSYVKAMAVNPAQPNWLYAAVQSTTPGSLNIYASPNRGQTWEQMGNLQLAINDLALAVGSHTLYAATESGVYQLPIYYRPSERFAQFYNTHDGLRLLGRTLSLEYPVNSYPSQYFEKGRLEDHSAATSDPNWRFMYGLLVDELQQAKMKLPVGGDVSTMTYADINTLAAPSKRLAVACAGSCPDGAWVYDKAAGTVFVPFSADLKFAPGHLVLGGFWNYINRNDLFPGGWLHDVGLPIMEPQEITVTKNLATGPVQRKILVQAFQRTILTYDPANPPEWQIERANIGTDYRLAFPDRVGP